MDYIYTAFFYIIAGLAVLSALGVVLARSIVVSAVSLIMAFLSIAGIFVLLNADFVAVAQVIIYAVGITIVMLFAIMLTGKKSDKKLWIAFAPRTLLALGIAGALFITIAFCATQGFSRKAEDTNIFNIRPPSQQIITKIQKEGTAPTIGRALLTKYVLPFEILSVLLLAAILGAAVIARKEDDNLKNPTTQGDSQNA